MMHPDPKRNPCKRCSGTGTAMYGSTATWHGGMGGASMAMDICDVCWGSGDADQPFEDQRKVRDFYHKQMEQATLEDWAKQAGCDIQTVKQAIPDIVAAIEKLERKRKPEPGFWRAAAYRALADALRKFI